MSSSKSDDEKQMVGLNLKPFASTTASFCFLFPNEKTKDLDYIPHLELLEKKAIELEKKNKKLEEDQQKLIYRTETLQALLNAEKEKNRLLCLERDRYRSQFFPIYFNPVHSYKY